MYTIEITYHEGSDREFGYDETHATLQQAVDRLNNWAAGHGDFVTCRINDKRVEIKGSSVVGKDGKPFCTNQAWHDIYADDDYPKIERRCMTKDELEAYASKVADADKVADRLNKMGFIAAVIL